MLRLEVGYDRLIVYDGQSDKSPRLASLSGATLPAALTGTGDTMLLVLKSDNELEQDGFDATFSRLSPVAGGMYVDSSSEATSAGTEGDSQHQSEMGKTVLFAGLGTLGVLAAVVGIAVYRRLRRTPVRVTSPSGEDSIENRASPRIPPTDAAHVEDIEMDSPNGRFVVGAPWDLPLIDLEEADLPPPEKPRLVWQEGS
jgi:hypothetical protein